MEIPTDEDFWDKWNALDDSLKLVEAPAGVREIRDFGFFLWSKCLPVEKQTPDAILSKNNRNRTADGLK